MLMKTKEKEIENLRKTIDFNLVRKEPNLLELRAYLYQILTTSFGLSEILKELFRKEFPGLGDDVTKWDLNAISEPDIRRILWDQGVLPDEIFYFKKEYNPDEVLQNDYKAFPMIFTRVCNVSFDNSGLIVLELYKSRIYVLFDANGEILWEPCYDVRLGTEGRAMITDTDCETFEVRSSHGEGNDDFDFFPDISGRDIIPEMLPLGTFREDSHDQSKKMSNEEVNLELRNNPESYHFLQKYYYDNEKLALIAVNSNLFAFTFLSERLQRDKEYVIKLISSNNRNQKLYNYLSNQLKADIEIVKLCIKSCPSIIRKIAPVSDSELMEEALKEDVFYLEYASEDLKSDKKLVLDLVRKEWRVLTKVSKVLLLDSAFIAEAIVCFNENQEEVISLEEDLSIFPFEKEIIDMNIVVKNLVTQCPCVLKHIAPVSDMNMIYSCLEYTCEEDIPFILDCISNDLKETRTFWKAAVCVNPYTIKNAPLIFKKDKDIVLSSLCSHGELIEFADESLRNDPEIILEAIKQIKYRREARNPEVISHLIPYHMIMDKTFLLNAVKDYPRIFEVVPMDLRSDREFMLQIIKTSDGLIIQYAAEELQSDKHFIVEAAKLNEYILRWLPENFKDDKELFELLREEGVEPIFTWSEADLFFDLILA